VERKILIKYDAYRDLKITDRYAFFKQEIEPTLLRYGKKYDIETDQDISSWKTYENKEYGFSFKYPPEANIDEESRKRNGYDSDSFHFLHIEHISALAKNYNISVSIYNDDVMKSDYGFHFTERMFRNIGKKRFGAVNYVEVDKTIGYAGYFCVTPWTRYNGEEYISVFTFYRKSGVICFELPISLYSDSQQQKDAVENVKKAMLSTIRFTQ